MSAGILPALMFAGLQPAWWAKAHYIPMPAKAGAPLHLYKEVTTVLEAIE
jgi:hypothetical protein